MMTSESGGRDPARDSSHIPAVRSAVDRGLDIVSTVRDSAAEALRTRRDPAAIAERRRVAARRRLMIWGLLVLVLAAAAAMGIAQAVRGDGTVASIGALVLECGLLGYSVIGGVAAARDLRQRTRVVRSLPPPQPARRAVGGAARLQISQLDGYSDALRASVGLVGVATGTAADDGIRSLRDDTLIAADRAEIAIRNKAAEYTALHRVAAAGAPDVATRREHLEAEIRRDVADYGRLVAAASDAAGASGQLAARTGAGSGLADATERLQALAAGMRELTEHLG